MSRSQPDHYVQSLIAEFLDGRLTEDQQRELLSLAQTDETVAQWLDRLVADHTLLETLYAVDSPEYFVRWVLLQARYQESGPDFTERVTQAALGADTPPPGDSPEAPPIRDVQRIKERAERQLRDFLAQREAEERQARNALLRRARHGSHGGGLWARCNRVLAISLRTARGLAVAAGILLLAVVAVQYHRSHRIVATVGETVDARWATNPTTTQLRPGWFGLEAGYAQLLLSSGAQVLVEAPAEFRLEGPNYLTLERGTLTAQVPPEAAGFTVVTPSSLVRDFGTEFGVAVDSERASEVHVFAGRVGVRGNGPRRSPLRELTRGQTALAELGGALRIGRISSSTRRFVRRLSELEDDTVEVRYLDLADVVGGGNGFGTGRLDWGVDPYTGSPVPYYEIYEGRRTSGPSYRPVPWHPFIDGVFIPGRQSPPPLIAQTGLRFAGWPQTKDTCYMAIVNGGKFGMNRAAIHQGRLQGQPVGVPGYPAIRMHANAGITFDLTAIRDTVPGRRMTRFGAVCGISETARGQGKATFWILVDGRRVFRRTLAIGEEPANVDLTLTADSRFLTLATTDHGGQTGTDWCLVAEPSLELVPVP